MKANAGVPCVTGLARGLLFEFMICPSGVLCVRLHAAGVPDSGHCDGVRHSRGDLLPVECGELPLAVDVFCLSRIHSVVSPFMSTS